VSVGSAPAGITISQEGKEHSYKQQKQGMLTGLVTSCVWTAF